MSDDEEATLAALKQYRGEALEPAIARHHGRIVKLMGDGVLAEFPSVNAAVECAIGMQDAAAAAPGPIRLRMGINLGDIIIDGEDIYGDGVNVAARLEALCEPGGLCISGIVHESLSSRVTLGFEDRGEHRVKNIARPIKVWHWVPAGAAPGRRETAEPAAPGHRPRVVILPFDNMVSDPAHEYLADGLCEDLTTALSKIDTLDVVSRTAAFVYKNRQVSAVEAARALDAGYAIEGSVRMAGRRVRINAQLIDRDTGSHIWAEKFDGGIDDVFELQDAITQQVVTALEVHLSDGAQVMTWRAEAGDPRAYEHFLSGRAAYKEYSRAGNARARRHYEDALEVSPRFVSAMAGLARTHLEDATFHWSADREQSIAEARRILDEAFAVAPGHALARAELAHALMVEGRFAEGRAEAMRAVAADPNLADALHVLSTLLVCLGEHAEALKYMRLCLKLNPGMPEFYQVCTAEALAGQQRFAEALATVRRILARRPEWLMMRALAAICHAALGDQAAARAEAQRIQSLNPRFTATRWRNSLFYPERVDVAELHGLLRAAGLPA